jgi:hypothetical protein
VVKECMLLENMSWHDIDGAGAGAFSGRLEV